MYRVFKFLSAVFLIGAFLLTCVSCNTATAPKKETEGTSQTSTVAETEAETKEPNPLEKIISIGLSKSGTCSIMWGDRHGTRTGKSVGETTRFLYKTKKNGVYRELTVASITSHGTSADINEGDELTHLIVVFRKGHKLTDDEKSIIEKFGIDYMFEK